MKDKAVMIITLVMLLLAFVASTLFGESPATGAIVAHESRGGSECLKDLPLLDGKYIVPCDNEKLQWENIITISDSNYNLYPNNKYAQKVYALDGKLNGFGFGFDV